MATFFRLTVHVEDARGAYQQVLVAYVDDHGAALEAAARWIARHGGALVDVVHGETEILEWEDVPREWLLPDVEDGIAAVEGGRP